MMLLYLSNFSVVIDPRTSSDCQCAMFDCLSASGRNYNGWLEARFEL